MKRLFLIVISLSLTFFSCDKHDPCNSEARITHFEEGEASWFLFSAGTWFRYINQMGEEMTHTIISDTLWYKEFPHEYEVPIECRDSIAFAEAIYYDSFHNIQFRIKSLKTRDVDHSSLDSSFSHGSNHLTISKKVGNGNSGASEVFFWLPASSRKSYRGSADIGGDISITNKYDSLLIQNKLYRNVISIKNKTDALFGEVTFYLVDSVGVVKIDQKLRSEPRKIWELTAHNIEW